ncbi:divalent-cation tolerance protein CutA [Roseobacter sinensis]|uniref:Divalent-cation tolerance protein CutA n=1 Tax=Roseobacter sinensis TaxID=2931391 RepID=A0ABT3BED9_9RHOB|nr:divalent-cation tolerance protein CutA [Roseobacter sp. WL0113]MCV3271514.1 divalent-cation tolerance protein CutA [Roseobacter sp. WL0113]
MPIIDILVNCPDIETADAISAALIEQRLVACANRYAPIQSSYRWQGKLEHEEEHPLLLKTRADLAQPVEDAIRALHPYEVPPIIRIHIDGANQDYIDWVYAETRAP